MTKEIGEKQLKRIAIDTKIADAFLFSKWCQSTLALNWQILFSGGKQKTCGIHLKISSKNNMITRQTADYHISLHQLTGSEGKNKIHGGINIKIRKSCR